MQRYLWLVSVDTPNGLTFYTIFSERETAIKHLEGQVSPEGWREDISGNLRQHDPERGYKFYITQEPYYE